MHQHHAGFLSVFSVRPAFLHRGPPFPTHLHHEGWRRVEEVPFRGVHGDVVFTALARGGRAQLGPRVQGHDAVVILRRWLPLEVRRGAVDDVPWAVDPFGAE